MKTFALKLHHNNTVAVSFLRVRRFPCGASGRLQPAEKEEVRPAMRLLLAGAALLSAAAYYVYLPLPGGVCEPVKLMLLDALFRSFIQASDVAHALGVCHRVHLLNRVVSWVEEVEARSCSAVHVTDSQLGGVPARVFQPKGGRRLKRGVVYFHGGGWALGSGRMRSYDRLCRKMAEDLDCVVVSLPPGPGGGVSGSVPRRAGGGAGLPVSSGPGALRRGPAEAVRVRGQRRGEPGRRGGPRARLGRRRGAEVQAAGADLPGAAGAGLPHRVLPAEPGRAHPPPAPHGPLLAAVPGRRRLPGAPPARQQPQRPGPARQAGLDRAAAGGAQEALPARGEGRRRGGRVAGADGPPGGAAAGGERRAERDAQSLRDDLRVRRAAGRRVDVRQAAAGRRRGGDQRPLRGRVPRLHGVRLPPRGVRRRAEEHQRLRPLAGPEPVGGADDPIQSFDES